MPNNSPSNKKLFIAMLNGISIGSFITTAAIGFIHLISKVYSFHSTSFNETELHNHEKTDLGLTERQLYLTYYSGAIIFSGALIAPVLYNLQRHFIKKSCIGHINASTNYSLEDQNLKPHLSGQSSPANNIHIPDTPQLDVRKGSIVLVEKSCNSLIKKI